jgi:excinuclease ABC subunit C
MNQTLKETVALLPSRPGVYKFFDKDKNILYIGKASSLKSRVSSYFVGDHFDRPRIIQMLDLVDSLETVETENDIESLILESALIRDHKPPYNASLKDDKSYAWLYINTQDDYPTVRIVRTVRKDEYKKGRLFGPYPSGRAIQRVFKYLRKLYPFCTSKDPTKPCFHYYIGLCPGPDATKEQYRHNIGQIIKFLQGKKKTHIRELERKMHDYAVAQNFEKAAELRDKISDLKYLGQKIGFTYFDTERDYILSREERIKESLEALCTELGLDNAQRIECYDISNIKGQLAYGSMVVAINGVPATSEYRVFKIREMDTSDDPAMLSEVLRRRLRYLQMPGDDSLNEKPDIILIDGATTQLKAVSDLIPGSIFLMGISKGRKYRRKGQKKRDEFWTVRQKVVLQLSIRNTQILSNLRDESHRFALLHHRKLRKFVQKKSLLDQVKGIGPKRKKELLNKFGSVKELKKVKRGEILKVITNEKVVDELISKLKET